jgi:hypothetical protein
MCEDRTSRLINWLRQQHASVCFENGWDEMEHGTAYGEGADALEAVGPLRDKVAEQAARIEALEAERDAAFAAGFEACREMAMREIREACIAPDGSYDMRIDGAIAEAEAATVEVACEAIRALQPEQHSKMEDE